MSISSQITRINNNIAAAYTACDGKGASLPQAQNSANLAETINSIPEGYTPVVEKALNFYDYDGTLVYSYSQSEALLLTELPAFPSHEGLIATEWTHTLSDILPAISKNHIVNVGLFYNTSDGKTHIFIRLEKTGDFQFYLIQSAANAAVIDWGDGSPTESLSVSDGTANNRTRYLAAHTYSPTAYPADYDISISAVSHKWYGFGTQNYSSYSICGDNSIYGSCIKRIWLSSDASVLGGSFCNTKGLEVIALARNQATDYRFKFSSCTHLKCAIISYGINQYVMSDCKSLETLILVNLGSTINSSALEGLYSLKHFDIPEGVVNLQNYCMKNCNSIEYILIPSTVTNIYNNAMSMNGTYTKLKIVDLTLFTDPDNIPSLATSFFSTFSYQNMYLDLIIFLVANETMKSAFSEATNWSEGADYYVVKE